MTPHIRSYEATIPELPPIPEEPSNAELIKARKQYTDVIIVLDDDPTGSQTVYDVPILTNWTKAELLNEIERGTDFFFILTNSRSLTESKAINIAEEIGINIDWTSQKTNKRITVINRGDSTLRGHYPAEVTALENGLQLKNRIHLIIPAFFEGGRYSISDIHYVKEGNQLIPAGQTPFADDHVFGYQSSNLKNWVLEKTNQSVQVEDLKSIDISTIRTKSIVKIISFLNQLNHRNILIVNAQSYVDLKIIALAIFQSAKYFTFRTAASFVAAMHAKSERPLLTAEKLGLQKANVGLVVVGSYVPKTTAQLTHLETNCNLLSIKLSVEDLLQNGPKQAEQIADKISQSLKGGISVCLFTSRELISDQNANKNIDIGRRISTHLTKIISNLTIKPAFLLAKGGITASDIATKSLGIKRAVVLGQIAPGIPVWKSHSCQKFQNLPYVIFPGNVGQESSLTVVFKKLTGQ